MVPFEAKSLPLGASFLCFIAFSIKFHISLKNPGSMSMEFLKIAKIVQKRFMTSNFIVRGMERMGSIKEDTLHIATDTSEVEACGTSRYDVNKHQSRSTHNFQQERL